MRYVIIHVLMMTMLGGGSFVGFFFLVAKDPMQDLGQILLFGFGCTFGLSSVFTVAKANYSIKSRSLEYHGDNRPIIINRANLVRVRSKRFHWEMELTGNECRFFDVPKWVLSEERLKKIYGDIEIASDF